MKRSIDDTNRLVVETFLVEYYQYLGRVAMEVSPKPVAKVTIEALLISQSNIMIEYEFYTNGTSCATYYNDIHNK